MTTHTSEQIVSTIIPSAADDKVLKESIAILISRVLISHMKFFNFLSSDVVNWHI